MGATTFYVKGKKYNCTKNGIPYFRKTAVIGGKQRSFYGDGEKDALRKIEEAKKLEEKGFDFDSRSAKTKDVFKHWLYDIKRIDRNIKASTFSTYDGQYRKLIEGTELGRSTLSALSSSMLQRFLTKKYEAGEITGTGAKYFLTLFKQFCKWAVNEGYIVKNPCSNIIVPGAHNKQKKVIETFTDEERSKLLRYMDATGYVYDDLIKLAFATGMRKGELLALKWNDIEDGVIHVRSSTAVFSHINPDGTKEFKREVWSTKTEAGARDIPILPSTQAMLSNLHHQQKLYCFRKRLPQSEYVFINSKGKLISPSNLQDSYSRLLDRAGIPRKKFHAIRHTFATEAIRHGVPVKDLQTLMGHTDISTTYIYVHASEGTKREAIEKIGEMMK